MASFVLIHGGCHGRWCWELIVPLLAAEGHRVAAPDLPGMGADSTPLADVTLEPEPVILVGHSRAGIVISQAAELVPDRIRLLVYLAAMLLPDGMSMFDMAKQSDVPQTRLSVSEDGLSFAVPAAVARQAFYNRTPEEAAARAIARLCPEPLAPGSTPLRLTEANFGRVERAYIGCSDDRTVISPTLRRDMLARTPCRRVIEMATDHSPFYSAPEELAGHLLALAAAVAP